MSRNHVSCNLESHCSIRRPYRRTNPRALKGSKFTHAAHRPKTPHMLDAGSCVCWHSCTEHDTVCAHNKPSTTAPARHPCTSCTLLLRLGHMPRTPETAQHASTRIQSKHRGSSREITSSQRLQSQHTDRVKGHTSTQRLTANRKVAAEHCHPCCSTPAPVIRSSCHCACCCCCCCGCRRWICPHQPRLRLLLKLLLRLC